MGGSQEKCGKSVQLFGYFYICTIFSALKFGFLPEIEWDGVRLAQSVAIYRLVAKEVGIAGKNNVEMAQCDAVVDFCSEMAEGKQNRGNDHWLFK